MLLDNVYVMFEIMKIPTQLNGGHAIVNTLALKLILFMSENIRTNLITACMLMHKFYKLNDIVIYSKELL
jgi:hypothetical protein